MNEIRAASMPFAAYLVISADAMSIIIIGLPVRTKGAYISVITRRAKSVAIREPHGPGS